VPRPSRRLLVTGGAGLLGRTVRSGFAAAGWDVVSTDVDDLDIRDRHRVHEAVGALRPDVVLNAAAIADADLCEVDPDLAFATNATAVGHLAEACHRHGAHLCQVSTDYVFGGERRQAYVEGDEPAPLSIYGRTKLDGERVAGPDALVVRTAWLSAPHGRNIVRTVLEQTRGDHPLAFVDDQRGSPTVAADLVGAILPLVEDRWAGLFHVTNQGEATWYDLARHVLVSAGVDPERVRPITTAELDPPRLATRPAFSVLDNHALRLAGRPPLRHWTDAVADVVARLRSGDRP